MNEEEARHVCGACAADKAGPDRDTSTVYIAAMCDMIHDGPGATLDGLCSKHRQRYEIHMRWLRHQAEGQPPTLEPVSVHALDCAVSRWHFSEHGGLVHIDHIDCAFCSDVAQGYTEDDEPTCGAKTCEPVARPLPRVVEVSVDDDKSEDDTGAKS